MHLCDCDKGPHADANPNIKAAMAVFKERKAGPESTDRWAEWVANLVVAAALTPGDTNGP